MVSSGCAPVALRRSTIALLTLVALLGVAACGAEDGPVATHHVDNTSGATTTRPAGAGPIPLEQVGPLAPGAYEADVGDLTVTFAVEDGWRMDLHRDYQLLLNRDFAAVTPGGDLRVEVGLLDPAAVPIDGAAGLPSHRADNAGPLPPDLAAWFADLPYIEPITIEPVEISGYEGRRVLARVTDVTMPSGECAPLVQADCAHWIRYGPTLPSALQAIEGSVMDNVFLETEYGPIVIHALGFDPAQGPDGQLAFIAGASAIVDSIEIHERVG